MLGRTRSAVRARLDAAPLPTELRAFIASLVARTKLRRAEQLDIAAELASHFSEGLAAGKSAETLVASYGDARQSAHDLRAGAIAKRHPLDRAAGSLFKWSAIGVAAAIAVYLASATAIYLREPVVSFDAQSAWNARLPKPGPEGRALDLYISALGDESGRRRGEWLARRLHSIDEAFERLDAAAGTKDPDAERAVRDALAEARVAIETLRQMPTRPVLGLALGREALHDDAAVRFFGSDALSLPSDPGVGDPAILTLLPQLGVTREAARLLCFDARLAARDGRGDEFMMSVEAAIMCGTHAGEPDVVISELIGMGIYAAVLETVNVAVERSPATLSDAQLDRLEHVVRGLRCDLAAGIEGERIAFRDLIQRSFSDNGSGDGVLLPRPWGRLLAETANLGSRPPTASALDFAVGPFAALAFPARREVEASVNRRFDAMVGALRAETPEAFEAHRQELAAMQADGEGDGEIFSLTALLPDAESLLAKPQRMRVAVAKTAGAISAERARREEVRAAAR
jgi:hypothetical protein